MAKSTTIVAFDQHAATTVAQHRLHRRYRRLAARGKAKQHVVTAVARELSGSSGPC